MERIIDLIKKHHVKFVILLLSLFSIQVLYCIFTYSSTYDEQTHLQSGYEYLKTGALLNKDSNVLRALNAVPLMWANITSSGPGAYDYGQHFFFYLRLARMVTLLFGILLGVFIFLITKELFGISAGLLSVFLYSFEPSIIAHSSLITADVPVTCLMLIFVYSFYKFVKTPTMLSAVVVGMLLGIAIIAKFSAVLLIPISGILLILHSGHKNKPKLFSLYLLILLVSVFVINTAFLFKGTFDKYDFGSSDLRKINEAFPNIRLPFPRDFLIGFDLRMGHAKQGHYVPAYLFGEFSKTGWWYYFIVAFIIKTPIALLILILLSFIFQAKRRTRNISFLLVPVLFIFVSISFFNHANVGLRYLLPAYPFLIVMAGSTIGFFSLSKRKKFLYFLVVWYLVSAVFIAPHQLAYYNEFIGGPKNGYKYLLDSNTDWGQNELLLGRYIGKINTAIIINPGCEYTSGRIAITANNLADYLDPDYKVCHEWLRNLTPIDQVGYGYLIYDVPVTE